MSFEAATGYGKRTLTFNKTQRNKKILKTIHTPTASTIIKTTHTHTCRYQQQFAIVKLNPGPISGRCKLSFPEA